MSKRTQRNQQNKDQKRADKVSRGTDPGGQSDYALKVARRAKGKPAAGSPFVVTESLEE